MLYNIKGEKSGMKRYIKASTDSDWQSITSDFWRI